MTATTELAGPAKAVGVHLNNLVEAEGTALELPVKIKLDNPFLGSKCFVGSNSHPIVIDLTTGTTSPPPPNTPISGKVGEVKFEDEFTIVHITNNSLVNNSFAAPDL